jgi:hypothetical protein
LRFLLLPLFLSTPAFAQTAPGPEDPPSGRWREQLPWLPVGDRLIQARLCRPEAPGAAPRRALSSTTARPATGGALALAAESPRQVATVVNVTGGRDGRAERVANADRRPDRLASGAAEPGRTARLPTLRVDAANDGFFSPDLAHGMHGAFIAPGGRRSSGLSARGARTGKTCSAAAAPMSGGRSSPPGCPRRAEPLASARRRRTYPADGR